MGNCTSSGRNDLPKTLSAESGIQSAPVCAPSVDGRNNNRSMMYNSTWAGPTSYSIDEGESIFGLFPPEGHRRTRSGYSQQLAYDPVHDRKMSKLKEIRQSQSMAELKECDEDAVFSPPPMGRGLSPVAPRSVRSKKTRPIKLKENRRMTAGSEVLAPRRARLKSGFSKQLEAQKERMEAIKMEGLATKEEGREDATPTAANVRTRRCFTPPRALDTSPAGTPRTSHRSAQSPKGDMKSPSRERVVSPFNEDLSLDVQRASMVLHSPKAGATSPKGTRKSPSVAELRSPIWQRGFFPDVKKKTSGSLSPLSVRTSGPQVEAVLHSPLSGATSPKGKRKTPTGVGGSFVATRSSGNENDGGLRNGVENTNKDAPGLADLNLSPRKRKGKGKQGGEWICKPKTTIVRKQRSLKEGGHGHLHPSAKNAKK